MSEEIKNEELEVSEPISGDNGWAKELEIRKEAAKTGKTMMAVLIGIIVVNLIMNQVAKGGSGSVASSWIIAIANIVASIVAIIKLSRAKMPYASVAVRLVLAIITQVIVVGVMLSLSTMSEKSAGSTLGILGVIGLAAFGVTIWVIVDYVKFDARFAKINPEENPYYKELN